MKKAFAISALSRRPNRAAATIFCLAGLVAGAPVLAKQCPRSQILWKSKNSCIDKAEAAKLGFYHGAIPKTAIPYNKTDPEPPAAALAPLESPKAPVADTPSSDAQAAPPAAAQTPATVPSPYGDLVIEEFAKAK
ncbi:MAG TPA: hypothetical protein VMU18_04965 [Rhodoblastus sp.]|nr:hypothetical protein [Rhodoblastus sp.]